jgi:hypothetical protein
VNWQKRPSFAPTFWFLAFVVVSWLLIRHPPHREFASDEDIAFDRKVYFDSGETVSISGTLSGAGLGYKNNTTNITCSKDRGECLITRIEQIGPHQIGRVDSPDTYKITKWDNFEIVSVDDSGLPTPCAKITVSVERKSETALWVREPINQAHAFCKNADTKIYKWTIEDSLFWQRMDKLSH